MESIGKHGNIYIYGKTVGKYRKIWEHGDFAWPKMGTFVWIRKIARQVDALREPLVELLGVVSSPLGMTFTVCHAIDGP